MDFGPVEYPGEFLGAIPSSIFVSMAILMDPFFRLVFGFQRKRIVFTHTNTHILECKV